MKFGLKTALISMALAALAAATVAWLSKDTIFHSKEPGKLVLPNGSTLPVNRWIVLGGEGLRYLGPLGPDDQWKLVYPGQRGDQVVRFTTSQGSFETIVTDFKINGPRYRGEYWIKPGRQLK